MSKPRRAAPLDLGPVYARFIRNRAPVKIAARRDAWMALVEHVRRNGNMFDGRVTALVAQIKKAAQ